MINFTVFSPSTINYQHKRYGENCKVNYLYTDCVFCATKPNTNGHAATVKLIICIYLVLVGATIPIGNCWKLQRDKFQAGCVYNFLFSLVARARGVALWL